MEKVTAFLSKAQAFVAANAHSWTVRLGVLTAMLVTLSQYIPVIQTVIVAFWPAGEAWLVVAAMWVGRSIGFLRNISAAADSLQGK